MVLFVHIQQPWGEMGVGHGHGSRVCEHVTRLACFWAAQQPGKRPSDLRFNMQQPWGQMCVGHGHGSRVCEHVTRLACFWAAQQPGKRPLRFTVHMQQPWDRCVWVVDTAGQKRLQAAHSDFG
jgi:hypothetical protein